MSMHFDSSLIAGAYHFGNRGLGVLGAEVPSTGTHGPGYIYNDLVLPDDAGKEVRGYITTHDFPANTFVAFEDTGFTVIGAPDGVYHATYRLYVDGADLGTTTFTVTIGGSVSASMDVTTDAAVFSGSAGVGVAAGMSITTDAAVFSGSADSVPAGPASCSLDIATADAVFAGLVSGLTGAPAMPSTGYLITETITNGQRRTVQDTDPETSQKDPAERVAIGFDFAVLMASVSPAPAPVVAVTRRGGAEDPDPAAMKDGSPGSTGSVVTHWVIGGVPGCVYSWRCEAYSAEGEKFALVGTMKVRTAV